MPRRPRAQNLPGPGHARVFLAGPPGAGEPAARPRRPDVALAAAIPIPSAIVASAIPCFLLWSPPGASQFPAISPALSTGQTRSLILVWLLIATVMGSHGLLDALTDGGFGIATFQSFHLAAVFLSHPPPSRRLTQPRQPV